MYTAYITEESGSNWSNQKMKRGRCIARSMRQRKKKKTIWINEYNKKNIKKL